MKSARTRWGVRPDDRIRILVIEDNPVDAQLLHDLLSDTPGARPEVFRAESLVDGLKQMNERAFDLVVLDLNLPDSSGLATLRWVRAQSSEVPIVCLTAIDDPETAARALRAGAHDYLVKGRIVHELLWRTLRAAARERQPAEATLQVLADDVERAAEERARQLEFAQREIDAFVHSAAHDLRTPLRTIGSMMALLHEDYGEQLDDDGADLMHRVMRAADRMDGLLDALLRYARLGEASVHREDLDLVPIARRLAEPLRRAEPERAVELVLPPRLPAKGDPALVEVLLKNLLGNAWKYTRPAPRPRIELGALPGEPTAYFVRDNGVGFDPARAADVFQPFQRLHAAHFEGTGLGLASVQQVVCRHLGRVHAEAAPGAGATFYFTLEPEQTRSVTGPLAATGT